MTDLGRPFDLDRVRARLDLDRDRITGLRAAAELMRNHADDADREAETVNMQRANIIKLFRDRVSDEQRDELESVLITYGFAADGTDS